MTVNDVILYLMAAFMVLGALDRIIGNRFGLGKAFEDGIMTFGSLALSMLGIICFAPVLADWLRPVIVPVYGLVGADPGMFPGSILACDMGGAALSMELAGSREAGLFGGVIIGSMLGATIVFTIPLALGVLRVEDRPHLAKGVLAGLITIPLGGLAGGLTAGFPLKLVLVNLIPIVLFAALVALGLWKAEKWMIKGFILFGRLILIVITVGLAAAIVEALTGIVVIPGLAPLSDGYEVIGGIAIILAGAFPLVHVITRVFRKPLMKLGGLLGMNETAAAGMVASLANSIPMFGMVKDMDNRGKVLNVAFAVSAAFVFGDHMGFTASFSPEMLLPVIVGKLTAGITAVAVALLLTRKQEHA